MLLAEELLALTQKLESTASLKEFAFYKHLIGSPLDYPHQGNELSEQEQVVFAAFCTHGPDKHLLAEKIRGTKPIKGMHYSNNLIELAAFARFDLEKETENIKNYAKAHSTKEFFVLRKLFPDVLDYPPAALKAIDHIALKLINGDLSSEDKATIALAIQATEDLLDVYILSAAYRHLLDLQPATQFRRDAQELAQQLSRLIRRVDIVVRIMVVGAIGYGLLKLYLFLIPIIIERWNQIEPRLFIIQLLFGSFVFLILVLIGVTPDKLGFINSTLRFIGTVVLRVMGINRRQAEKRIVEYLKKPDVRTTTPS